MKKIAILLPVMPQFSYSASLVESLNFLTADFSLEFIDPLLMSQEENNKEYYQNWETWFRERTYSFCAYIGFSFGGVILQQIFPYLERLNKPVILFSTPTFADEILQLKLSKVIDLCRQQKMAESLVCLYQHAAFPKSVADIVFSVENHEQAQSRLMFGLQKVLDTDSAHVLELTQLSYTHFIGAQSDLVNTANVKTGKYGDLQIVPHAGMRVLEDNLDFCKPIMLERLYG